VCVGGGGVSHSEKKLKFLSKEKKENKKEQGSINLKL
jgi:hypothetical protein